MKRNNRFFITDIYGREHLLPIAFQLPGVEINSSDDGIYRVRFNYQDKVGYFKVGK